MKKSENVGNNALIDDLTSYYRDQLGHHDYERRVADRLNRIRGKTVINRLQEITVLKGKKILEVGSGWGEICIEACNAGGTVVGLEPNFKRIRLVSKSETTNSFPFFIQGMGEAIPCKDGLFDIIICHGVLEHVVSIERTLEEMVRVLKQKGIMFLSCPNYLFPFEGHYEVWFPPLCPKRIAQMYLKIRGKNPRFIEHINYTTPYLVYRCLKKCSITVKNIFLEKQKRRKPRNKLIHIFRIIQNKLQLYFSIEWLVMKQ
ncbi:class I SAM-dependent methyltransferase [Chlamydiota bacterium]